MRGAGAGDPTVLYALAVLQAVMAFAVTDERIADDPVRSVHKPARTVERDVPPVLVERMRVLMLARSTTNGLRDALIVTLIAHDP